MHIPCARDVPRRHPASIATTPELVRAFVAVGAVDDIAPLIGVGRIAVEGYRTIVRVVEVVVAIAVLYLLLEVLVGVEGRLASGILQAPAREGGAVALDIGRLKTAEEVERVDSEGAVIVRRSAEVVVAHAVLTLVHEAAIRQDGAGEIVGMIRVTVEVLVGLSDDAVGHGTVGQCLVRVVTHVVLL